MVAAKTPGGLPAILVRRAGTAARDAISETREERPVTRAQRFDSSSEPAARAATRLETTSDAALVDRLQMLRSILPGMATEVAIARRETARLRRENAALQTRLGDLERRGAERAASPL
jgi:hypothetical protein